MYEEGFNYHTEWTSIKRDPSIHAENRLVRPSPEADPVCYSGDPADAKWIAERLNLAAKVQAMAADFVDYAPAVSTQADDFVSAIKELFEEK